MADEDKFTRRKATEVLIAGAAASALTGDTEQPWPPADGLSDHDIDRLVHWGQGADADGRPYGDYQGVRTRIYEAHRERQSITPILEQLHAERQRINPMVMYEHLLDILIAYDHGNRLTAAERQAICNIVASWPQEFEVNGVAKTRISLVDGIVGSAPVMRELLINETILSKDELERFNQG